MKTTHLIYSTLFLFVFGSAQAQWWQKKIKGNGKMTTEMRQTDSYDAIHVHGSVHVTLTSGNEGDITIVAEENLMEYIETVHKKETLHIKTKENTYLGTSLGKEINIYVPVAEISKLSLSGSGDIEGGMSIESDKLKVSLSGSGDVDVDVDVAELHASVTGSGDIDLSGKAHEFNASVTGSGDINAKKLTVNNCQASITGSGDIAINALNHLNSTIVGSGDILVNLSVKTNEKKIVGSGKVMKY